MELEAKVRVVDHDPIRDRLRACGARPEGRVLETNHIFDHVDGSLRASDRALRVRTYRAIEGPPIPATLTYKGPCRPGALKHREEIELTVDDPDAARRLLESLHFTERLAFEKRRETWLLDECRVELDELPHLGRFVEVEGPDERSIRDVLARLDLAEHPLVQASYIALLVEHCRQHNLPLTPITFPS